MRHAPVRPIHDPNINYMVIAGLIQALFGKEIKRLTAWTDKMIGANNRKLGLSNETSTSFLYEGTIYRRSGTTGRQAPPKLLDPEMFEEMVLLLQDAAIVDDQRASVQQVLVNLFDPCTSKQDMRDTLPECLVGCVPEFQRMERTREPAWTIAHNPRAMRQYAKLLPLMESYAAARLIF